MFLGERINLEEKIFLFIFNSPGVTADKVVKQMHQFYLNDDEKKVRKKVFASIKKLNKQSLLYIQDQQRWDMSVISLIYINSSDEAADYYNKACHKCTGD